MLSGGKISKIFSESSYQNTEGMCNNSGTVHEFAGSALKLILLDSHMIYCI